MSPDELQSLVDDATYDFAMGEAGVAESKLKHATGLAPDSFEAWHALAEVSLGLRKLDEALIAAERAHALRPADLLINATLSRVWMERGDKPKAEHFGAQARIQSWKAELKEPPPDATQLH